MGWICKLCVARRWRLLVPLVLVKARCCIYWADSTFQLRGEVYVAGQRMSALSDGDRGRLRNKTLGLIYQFHHLLPEFIALENVMMPVLLSGQSVWQR